jgi:sec-independent protein translocase protein TatB
VLGIGWTEFILIAVVLLIIVGPKHLPKMFRKLGKITAEFRAASRELRNQIELEGEDLESPKEIMRDLERDVLRKVNEPYAELAEKEREIRRDVESGIPKGGPLGEVSDDEKTNEPSGEGADSKPAGGGEEQSG